VYLIASHSISFILPFIKIDAITIFFNARSETPIAKAVALKQVLAPTINKDAILEAPIAIPWLEIIWFIGAFIAFAIFIYKLYQIKQLKKNSRCYRVGGFKVYNVPQSKIAFSFFKYIFIGESILENQRHSILEHELIHVRQLHSIDLLFYELLRICCWFNPFVYIYQNKTSELHEFIVDAEIAKTDKIMQYQLLLSHVFDTENISFTNQFFKSSLIKKRIVMLQKSKSKSFLKLKFAMVLPVILLMLVFTSISAQEAQQAKVVPLEEVVVVSYLPRSFNESTMPSNKRELTKITKKETAQLPIDKLPVFPGCENAEDAASCFQEMMHKHVGQLFIYPEAAAINNEQGLVNVLFTIDKNGVVSDKIRVRKMGNTSIALEDEARRIISKLPKMSVGAIDKEKEVPVVFSMAINFILRGQ
tara:strand:+ start:755 stop:2008 length:1254 start_codon:yes stop_codon:yes gene_type:complete